MNLRPKFHITGETGWINDPNGLIYYKGLYHVFFQYYPHATQWGPMHWGHVVSKDLLHWDRLPVALYPNKETKEDGCFSGTAIVHNDKMYLIYTGFHENGGGDNIRQLQCLASSDDGINFTKHGVVIGEDNLPSEYSACDFRDPKVWKENDTFYMIVAARKNEGKGHILMYKSLNLFDWKFVGDILEKESLGIMIECPDYSKELNMLFYSEQFQPSEDYYHLNVHSCRYASGNFDVSAGKFTEKSRGIVDYGFDFYAPQTFEKKNVMIGWLNMWDRNNPSEKYGFAGSLTIPRNISVVDNKLYQTPVWDYTNAVTQKVGKTLVDTFKIGAYKLEVESLKDIKLKLRKKGEQYFSVSLEDGLFVFDRSNSGEEIKGVETDTDSINGIRRMPLVNREKVTIEIISDEFSLEFFINGLAASFLIYPDLDSTLFELELDADKCVSYKSEF